MEDSEKRQEWLQKEERLEKVLKPAPIAYIIGYIFGSIILIAGINNNIYVSLFGALFIFILDIYRRSHKYYITNKRIIYSFHFLSSKYTQAYYSKIQDISLYRSFMDSILGIGNLKINTAGSGGHEINIRKIKSPKENKKLILNYLHNKEENSTIKEKPNHEEIENYYKLWKKGIITEEEFKNKKKKLLEE